MQLVLRHTEKCVKRNCGVCNKLRMRINSAFGTSLPMPDEGADDRCWLDGADAQVALPASAAALAQLQQQTSTQEQRQRQRRQEEQEEQQMQQIHAPRARGSPAR